MVSLAAFDLLDIGVLLSAPIRLLRPTQPHEQRFLRAFAAKVESAFRPGDRTSPLRFAFPGEAGPIPRARRPPGGCARAFSAAGRSGRKPSWWRTLYRIRCSGRPLGALSARPPPDLGSAEDRDCRALTPSIVGPPFLVTRHDRCRPRLQRDSVSAQDRLPDARRAAPEGTRNPGSLAET